MRVAIVYDSRSGTTRQAAEAMAALARDAGHTCTVSPVQQADPSEVSTAEALCIGSWTQGFLYFWQHATRGTHDFIERLGPLQGQPAAVFCTYKTSPGRLLDRMADALRAQGADVTGQFRSRGPRAPEGFQAWVDHLAAREETSG